MLLWGWMVLGVCGMGVQGAPVSPHHQTPVMLNGHGEAMPWVLL